MVAYTFAGYIQTPVSGQADAGRFIVDFLNSSSVNRGNSFTTSYQSNSGGSGTGWILYSNLRSATAGTRTIRIRLQATIATGPAINAYFDDISFVKSTVLPITLICFTGSGNLHKVTV